MKKKMLITGVSGLLGNNLAFFFRDKYQVLGLYHSHPVSIEGVELREADLLSENSLSKAIRDFNPDILIHCASLTNVDSCETEKTLAAQVNTLGTKAVVNTVLKTHCKLVYISTDLVYDGSQKNNSEDGPVNPLNTYGITKLEGEKEALRKPGSLVLRTNIFGWNIQKKFSLAEWILDELSQKHSITGFNDVYFSSIYTFDLAKILDLAIESDIQGIYNCGCNDSISKYEFALQIADRFNLNKSLIKSTSVDDFQFKAKRSKNLSLDLTKIIHDLGFIPPKITESLDNFYQNFTEGLPQKIRQNRQSKIIYPQLDLIPYGRQSIDNEDIQAVVAVLKSKNLTQGPKISEFESALCKVTGAKYAVVVNSGTAALHLACLVAGVGIGDEVITSSNTFVASANCIAYCSGTPVFADVDPATYNISPQEIEKKVSSRTRGIIPVHFAGQSCDMESILNLIHKKEKEIGHKIYIIEDASHALGSFYKDKAVGSCTFSDMTVMSFHPVKHITTGEGGVIFTNDEDFYKKLLLLRSHGITRYPNDPSPWYYEQVDLGYNYRITDIQAALGISQLKKLPADILRRREVVKIYNEQFKNLESVQIPFELSKCVSNFHLYVLLIDFEKIKMTRSQMMGLLQENGIQSQVHYIPVHTQPFYRKNYKTNDGDCPHAEKYYQKCLSLPLFPAMTQENVNKVVETFKKIIQIN